MAPWNPNRPMMGNRSFGGFPGGIPQGNWQGGAGFRPPGGGFGALPLRMPPPPLAPGGGRYPDFGGGRAAPRYPGPGFTQLPIRIPEQPLPGGGFGAYPRVPGGGQYQRPGAGGGGYYGQPGQIGGIPDPFLAFIRSQYGQRLGNPYGQLNQYPITRYQGY